VKLGSLCSGIGGLEMGVTAALGCEVAWQAEIDPAASAVLAHHWPDVPNIGDLRDLTAMTPVDILTAGYPCQPFSTAGRRKGTDDPRHLWPAVHAAIAHLAPRLVILENVRGHLSLGFDRVLGDLADIGYDAEWRVVRASDVGCCHQRARLFVAAYPDGSRLEGRPQGRERGRERAARSRRVEPAADATHVGRQRAGRTRDRGTGPQDSSATPPDATGAEREATQPESMAPTIGRTAKPRERHRPDAFGPYAAAVHRQEQWHGPAPDPTTDGRLNPRFCEWMMGYPAGWAEPAGSRNNQLRCLGNAVVPQVAHAFTLGLLGELPDGEGQGPLEMLPTPMASDWKGPNHSGSQSASAHGMATVAEQLLGLTAKAAT